MLEIIRVTKEEFTADSLKVLFEIDAIKKSIAAELFLEQDGSSKEDYKALLAQSKRVLETLGMITLKVRFGSSQSCLIYSNEGACPIGQTKQ